MIYMTNEEAVEILKGAIKKPNTKDGYLGQAIDMAIKALEQESSEDCVKREPIQKAIKDMLHWINSGNRGNADYFIVDQIEEIIAELNIDNLPSVTPQPKIGHWIYTPERRLDDETDEGRIYITDYRCSCSECGGDFGFQKMSDAYCKYCGAKMEVEEK